ncbi:MAG TPA: dienelactone hydrolase family protein [Vicinamibacterales bacterium]|nr:dienelactone hydrolase family protein [Vicinamibacterales bacterium]
MFPDVPPHGGQPVVETGVALGQAPAVVIMVHGRNAGPANILDLAARFERPKLTYLAPAASGGTWYPFSFMADIASNEPGISSGIAVLSALVRRIEHSGIPTQRIVLAGFSQGACLTSEFAIRHPARYGGVLVFTGGAIGPPGTTWDPPSPAGHGAPGRGGHSFDGTPVFIGCGDRDAHVPEDRARETANVFSRLGADVTLRIYPGMGHVVNDDEIVFAQGVLDAVSS